MARLSTGSEVLDELLGSGYEDDVVSTIYGPAGSGKSTLCLLAAISAAKDKKVIFIDTEGGFSVERLRQLTKDHERVLKNIFLLKPTTFQEQKKAFEELRERIEDNKNIGLIVVDTITMLYRLERSEEEIRQTNRELGRQVGYLTEIARKRNIPIILANQVYSPFDQKGRVEMVGGDIIKYGSKCLVELQAALGNKRRAILRKHRHLPQREVIFEILQDGIKEAKSKGFKLF